MSKSARRATPRGTGLRSTVRVERRKAPEAELGLTVDLVFKWTARHKHLPGDIVIKGSKSLSEMPQKDHLKLFLHKCKECEKLCDFSDSGRDGKAKLTKTQLLRHMIQAFGLTTFVKSMTPEVMNAFYDMVAANIFRTEPHIPITTLEYANDHFPDASWPHLSLVYDALLASISIPLTATCMNESFLYKLIRNGTSIDDRERAAVRDILHSIYARYMPLRPVVRSYVGAHFSLGRCSSALLTFYKSVVTGLNSPLKAEHSNFFFQFILPLHCLDNLSEYSEQLGNCIAGFVSKDESLLLTTFAYIRTKWPRSGKRKQIALLREVSHLMTLCEKSLNAASAAKGFEIIAGCVASDNADIASEALDILLTGETAFVIKKYSDTVFPVLISHIARTARNHWDPSVKSDAVAMLEIINELDPELMTQLIQKNKTKKENERAAYKKQWEQIIGSVGIKTQTARLSRSRGL